MPSPFGATAAPASQARYLRASRRMMIFVMLTRLVPGAMRSPR